MKPLETLESEWLEAAKATGLAVMLYNKSREETRRLRIALFDARQKEDRAYDRFKEAQEDAS